MSGNEQTVTRLTMLNGMAGADFEQALDRHLTIGIDTLDLKDAIFGKTVETLLSAEVAQAADLIAARGMTVHCLSTGLGNVSIDKGEVAWRKENLDILGRVLAAADLLKPRTIRIVAAYSERGGIGTSFPDHTARHAWIGAAYGELVARVVERGYGAVIENEAHQCIVTSPSDGLALFAALPRPADATFIWDVQNMWQMGSAPDRSALAALTPILSAIHLKGGIVGPDGHLQAASSLRRASWDVLAITRAAIASGKVPVICLNPSHGEKPRGWDVWDVAQDDVAYLRQHLPVA